MSREILLLALVTALAAGLRFYDLTYQGLWGDEAFSLYDAKGVDMRFMTASLVDVTHKKFLNPRRTPRDLFLACIRNEGTPPAYFVSLALWIKTFGSGDLACRSLSAVLGVLAVPLFFLLGRRLFNERGAAILATLFLAVSPLNIYFSQEVRAYMFANCAAIASSWLLLRALDSKRRAAAWAAYVIASLAVCYSFYFAALVLLAHALYVLLCERKMFRAFLLSMVATGALYSPWILVALRTQLAVSSGYAPPGPTGQGDFLRAFLPQVRYVLDSLVLGPMYSSKVIGGRMKAGIEAGLLALLSIGCMRLVRRGEGRAVAFSLFAILVPLALICGFGWLKGTLWYMKPRYHMWEAQSVFLLAAGAIMTLRGAWLRALLSGAFCTLSLAAGPYHFYPGVYDTDHSKPDFRAAAVIISEREERGDIIIINIPGHMIPLNIYYRGGLRQVGMAECGRYDLVGKLREYTGKRRRVWALIGLDTLGHGDKEITAYLDGAFPSKEVHHLRKLRLTLYWRDKEG